MFYDSFIKICENYGKSKTRVLRDLGMSTSMLENWKRGGEPLNETKKKLADYFGVTVSELIDGEFGKKEKPVPNEDELDAELIKLLTSLDPIQTRWIEGLLDLQLPADQLQRVVDFASGLSAAK